MTATAMRIDQPDCETVRTEIEVISEHLPLDGTRVLELGCGAANMTRQISERFPVQLIVATEVDERQHAKNLAGTPIDRVEFHAGGAEAIDAGDASFDRVLMFKSLHHVPEPLMDQALGEIARVLKPGGLAYLSEPVYAGAFNDILRLFHDEKRVRAAAFDAIRRAVNHGMLELQRQVFFLSPNRFESFEEFDRRILQATHTEHRLAPELFAQVKRRFEAHLGEAGAHFQQPMRVDLLRKPAA